MAISFPKAGGSATSSVAAQQGAGVSFPTIDSDIPDIEFTPQGSRFTPFGIEDFVATDQDDDIDALALEEQIRQDLELIGLGDPDPAIPPVDIDAARATDAERLDQVNDYINTELMRVDQVIGDSIGEKWQGSKAVGPMSFNVSDGLARRRAAGTFADRQAYFKKHYPEGKYARIPTGGGKYSEVYSITPEGDVFNVDPTGFSDISNELASLEANLLNFTTAGSVAGTFVEPLVGTFGGAALGNLIDQALVNETADSKLEIMQKLRVGDAATIGLIDSLITKFMPILGGKFRAAMFADEGGSVLAKKSSGPQALEAQKAAERLELPLLTAAQLASENRLIQAAFTQTAGTSSIPGRLMNNQQRKLYERLEQQAKSDFDAFTQGELTTYTKLQQLDLAEQVYKLLQTRYGGSLPEGVTLENLTKSIRESAGKLQTSHNELIDEAYKKAFNTSGAQNVVFDLSPAVDAANRIRQGVRIRKKPQRMDKAGRPIDSEGKLIATPTVRAQGELSGELDSITNALINIIDPTIKKLVVKDKNTSAKTAFDALSQLKALRDRASRLVGTDDSVAARELVDAIDEVMNNPVGGGKEFLKFYDEAKQLAKLKADTLNASNIATMFSRKSEVMPNELAEKFWKGEFTSQDWDFFTKMAKGAAGNKPDAKIAAQQLIADVQDGFITWLYQNPAKTQERIRQIREADGDLFEKMVPDPAERAALKNIEMQSSWVQSDGVNAALQRKMTVGERALKALDSMTEAEVIDLINKNGGIDGKVADQMRSALFKRILDRSTIQDKQGLFKITPDTLAKDFTQLVRFSSQDNYGRFKPLFVRAKLDGDVPKYQEGQNQYLQNLQDNQIYTAFLAGFQLDAGGQIQAAETVSKLARLKISGYRTILTNNIMASFFASPPSVAQLKKLHGDGAPKGIVKFWNKRRSNVIANLLGQLGESLSKDVETPKEEVDRTGKLPEMGDKFSSVATPSAPVQTVSAPPVPTESPSLELPPIQLASAPTGKSSAPFQSLFPRDELGGAIANRQGIMGLA